MKEQTSKYFNELLMRYPILSVNRNNILNAYELMLSTYLGKGKVLIAGNGGSAADADHIEAELLKSFIVNRTLDQKTQEALIEVDCELGMKLAANLQKSLPAISLVNHIAFSSAFLNDVNSKMGYAQLTLAYGALNDIYLGITTSGKSKNVIMGAIAAKAIGMSVIILSGKNGGNIVKYSDISILVHETEAYKIQELHLPIYHTICLMLEEEMFSKDSDREFFSRRVLECN